MTEKVKFYPTKEAYERAIARRDLERADHPEDRDLFVWDHQVGEYKVKWVTPQMIADAQRNMMRSA